NFGDRLPAGDELILHGREATLEFFDRPLQHILGVERRETSDVDEREQRVPQLFLKPVSIADTQRRGRLADFLVDLRPGGAGVRPKLARAALLGMRWARRSAGSARGTPSITERGRPHAAASRCLMVSHCANASRGVATLWSPKTWG